VGAVADLLALAGPATSIIDLHGAAVLPGFIDPHTHILSDSGVMNLSPVEAQALALRYGITATANMLTTPRGLTDAIALAEQGDVHLRFSLYLAYNNGCGEILGDWYRDIPPFEEIAPRLRVGGIKIFSEISGCGDLPTGISFTEELRDVLTPAGIVWYGSHRPLFSTEELAEVIREAQSLGYPVAIHAIGDGGVQVSLDAIEAALGGASNDLRHTILHNLFIRDVLLSRYATLGIVAAVESVTPCFSNVYRDMLPLGLKNIVRRWADVANTGAHLVADSDWPWCAEEAINPLFRLQALMSPENHSPSYGKWEPCGLLPDDQLLTAWQGLRMMTIEAAYMLHWEEDLGTLEPGKLADLVVLSENPLEAPAERLTDIQVIMTLIGGNVEYAISGIDEATSAL
jgi:predicted amidohydrolase YtcJ